MTFYVFLLSCFVLFPFFCPPIRFKFHPPISSLFIPFKLLTLHPNSTHAINHQPGIIWVHYSSHYKHIIRVLYMRRRASQLMVIIFSKRFTLSAGIHTHESHSNATQKKSKTTSLSQSAARARFRTSDRNLGGKSICVERVRIIVNCRANITALDC